LTSGDVHHDDRPTTDLSQGRGKAGSGVSLKFGDEVRNCIILCRICRTGVKVGLILTTCHFRDHVTGFTYSVITVIFMTLYSDRVEELKVCLSLF